MPSNYSINYSPCCDEPGHRPASDTGTTFFCMSCGGTFVSEVQHTAR